MLLNLFGLYLHQPVANNRGKELNKKLKMLSQDSTGIDALSLMLFIQELIILTEEGVMSCPPSNLSLSTGMWSPAKRNFISAFSVAFPISFH